MAETARRETLHPAIRSICLLVAVAIGFVALPMHALGLVNPSAFSTLGLIAVVIVLSLLLRAAVRGRRFKRAEAIALGTSLVVTAWTTRAAHAELSYAMDSPYRAAMRSALRTLANEQKAHLDSTGRFARNIASFSRANSQTELQLVEATDAGWRAVARHARTKRTCSVTVTRESPIPDSLPCDR